MKRNCLEKLKQWQTAKNGKPLLLDGARQVGKTWLLEEFGRQCFKNTAYVGLDRKSILGPYFESGDVKNIISAIGIVTGQKIVPGETLVVLDEIQAMPAAITCLKYFAEEAPEYCIAAAGSLLGLSANYGSGFPVGKTHGVYLYPMTFLEFMQAVGDEALAERLEMGDFETLERFKSIVERRLRQYFYVGGMPAAVKAFCNGENYAGARDEQKRILSDYRRDFAKHAGNSASSANIRLLWDSIPQQMARENRKFVFGAVREGGRGRDFISSIEFLKDAGLCHEVRMVSKPEIPLSAYVDSSFKIYGLDIGLLSAKYNLESIVLLEGNSVFGEFKGALTEQYVLQEMIASGIEPFYWSAKDGRAEIDFLIQSGMAILPVEVKAERNLRSKSLRAYAEKYCPKMCVKTSMSGYHYGDGILSLPLYGICKLEDEIGKAIGAGF